MIEIDLSVKHHLMFGMKQDDSSETKAFVDWLTCCLRPHPTSFLDGFQQLLRALALSLLKTGNMLGSFVKLFALWR